MEGLSQREIVGAVGGQDGETNAVQCGAVAPAPCRFGTSAAKQRCETAGWSSSIESTFLGKERGTHVAESTTFPP